MSSDQKPWTDRLVVVTASANTERALACFDSWKDRAFYRFELVIAEGRTADGYIPPVPAFAAGVAEALEQCPKAEVIACFHDDLLIEADNWDTHVLRVFDQVQDTGLAGFGGARGLGLDEIYKVPYNPHQLARIDFRSNMRDAELHGSREQWTTQVACLDGFSQIGRREFWQGFEPTLPVGIHDSDMTDYSKTAYLAQPRNRPNLFQQLTYLGFRHHFYDGALGCFAKRLGWKAAMIPVRCHHFGGQTAVADEGYHAWAKTQVAEGDQGFWEEAHRIGYEEFRDVLPIRV